MGALFFSPLTVTAFAAKTYHKWAYSSHADNVSAPRWHCLSSTRSPEIALFRRRNPTVRTSRFQRELGRPFPMGSRRDPGLGPPFIRTHAASPRLQVSGARSSTSSGSRPNALPRTQMGPMHPRAACGRRAMRTPWPVRDR